MNAAPVSVIPIWELSPRDHRICSYCRREFQTITAACQHERDCATGKQWRADMRAQADQFMAWAHEHLEELR